VSRTLRGFRVRRDIFLVWSFEVLYTASIKLSSKSPCNRAGRGVSWTAGFRQLSVPGSIRLLPVFEEAKIDLRLRIAVYVEYRLSELTILNTICVFPWTFPGYLSGLIVKDILNLNSGTLQGHVFESWYSSRASESGTVINIWSNFDQTKKKLNYILMPSILALCRRVTTFVFQWLSS